MRERYQSATDLMESARDAAKELERINLQLASMDSARDVKAQGYSGVQSHSNDVNGMGATERLIDYEERVKPRLRADEAILEDAMNMLYGTDGRGGVSKGIGSCYADVLMHRYLLMRTWDDTGWYCRVSKATAKRYAEVALDYIDAAGFEAAMIGKEL